MTDMCTRVWQWSALALVAVVLAGCAALDTPEPFAGGPSEFTGLGIETWQTDNGAKVLFVNAPELPMVDIQVVFAAGSARDGDRPGLARLTSVMLDEGAGALDADAIAQRFDAVGASFGASTNRDTTSVSLRSLTRIALLQPALETFALVLSEPSFDPAAFQRERQRTLVALRNLEQNPGALASRAFYRSLYGEHPYATPELGDAESVAGFTPEDLRAFYTQHYVARNALVAIVGAVSRGEAERLAETVVGRLPAGEPAPPLPAVRTSSPRAAETVSIAHPSAQTHLLVGQMGVRRGDPDYFPLLVGNHILGGSGFGSRVLTEVREARGLAYSAYSSFVPLAVEGPFVMGLQTATAQAEQAHEVLLQTLREFVAKGPSAEELADAKRHLSGGFPLRIASNSSILGYLAVIGFYDLPLDYLQQFVPNVEAVTVEDIRRAFQRIDPDSLLTVEVGRQAAD